MNLDTFFEKFDLFADAPDAVQKMREIILELAVQGRLVNQNAADGHGRSLLNQIREKTCSVSNSKEAEDGPVLQSMELPSTWALAELGSVTEIIRGVSFPGSAKSDAHCDGYVACLRTASVQNEIDWEDLIYIPSEHVTRAEQWIAINDIIISMANSYSLVGKVAIIRKIPQQATFGAFLAAIRPILIEPYFLLYVLRSPQMQAAFRNSSSQTTNIANISLGRMRPLPFPVPPLAEQKRIVAKVDELMALCDRLEAQQQERETRHTALAQASLTRFADAPTPANLEFLFHKSYAVEPAELRKTILTLAVLGRLVPQDVADDPPSSSFHGIKAQDTNVWGGTEIPNQWILSHYRSLTSLVTSGSRGWKEYYSNSGAIFIRTQNIKTDRLVLDDVAFVDLPKSTEGMRTQVMKNDIMITITGANVTKAARVEESIAEAYVSQHIALTRPRWPDMSKWLHLCFLSDGAARGVLEKLAYGDKPGLNLNNIRDLVMPIPPLPEQKRIVAKVEQLMALVDRLEAQLVESRGKGAALLEAVVAELSGAV